MTASSDLDLILVYDFDEAQPDSDGERPLYGAQYFARLTKRLISALTSQTNYGALYHVDRLPSSGIDAYERLDLGVTWRLRHDVELALWGQNLIEPHVENGAVEVSRGGYLQLRLDL